MPYFETVPGQPGLNRLPSNPCKLLDFQFLILADGEKFEGQTSEREVLAVVGAEPATEDTYLARERHVAALRAAAAHLDGAAAHVATRPPPIELFAEELREAQRSLAAITGEFTADDLLGVIFSRFCIGK